MTNSNRAWQPTTDQFDQLIVWVRQAGHIALRYFKNVTPRFKPDQSLVTEADLEIEQFLTGQMQTAFPDHTLISEERQAGAIEADRPIWTLDPLDGTTAFAQGLPGWGIALGLLDQGQPCFGLFYMPLTNDLSLTTPDGQVYGNERNLRRVVRRAWGSRAFLAVGASAHRDFQIEAPRLRALGSVSANLVYTARGAATAALIPRAYLWDLVAGAAILRQAGGELRYLSGRHLDYATLLDGQLAPEPIIAGHPNVLAELQSAIRPLANRTE